VGDDSSRWELLSDEEAKAALVVRLKRTFPDIAHRITMPTSFKMTRHGADPLIRGAYVDLYLLDPKGVACLCVSEFSGFVRLWVSWGCSCGVWCVSCCFVVCGFVACCLW
jgi:hypothetical protein